MSSDPGDVILDPFCGCGTAVVAAEKLGRKWIGIDITHLSVALMKNRLIGCVIALGLFETFVTPQILARMWRNADRGGDPMPGPDPDDDRGHGGRR